MTRFAWLIAPTGTIHWAHTAERRWPVQRTVWIAACNAVNGGMGWFWELDEARELDTGHRPRNENVCFFCRALRKMGAKKVNPRQLSIFDGGNDGGK